MSTAYLRDQHGIAMIIELVLVVAVASIVGLAVYQASHRATSVAATSAVPAAPSTPVGIAASAAAVAEQSATTDDNLSTAAESAADQVAASDTDVTNLGGSSDATSF